MKQPDWRPIFKSHCGRWRVTGNGLVAHAKEITDRDTYTTVFKFGASELDEWMKFMKSQGLDWYTVPGGAMHLPRDTLRNRAKRTPHVLVTMSECGGFRLFKNQRGYKVDRLCYIGTPQQCWNSRQPLDEAQLARYVEQNGIVWK